MIVRKCSSKKRTLLLQRELLESINSESKILVNNDRAFTEETSIVLVMPSDKIQVSSNFEAEAVEFMPTKKMGFYEVGVHDKRLLKALDKLQITVPTLVQKSALPLIIDKRKNVLVKAKTGSGKTLVYALPVLMNLLSYLDSCAAFSSLISLKIKAVILVPSKELAKQVTSVLESLMEFFPTRKIPMSKLLMNLCSFESAEKVKKRKVCSSHEESRVIFTSLLQQQGPGCVLVATPSRLLECLAENLFCLRESMDILAVDEADLLFGFGFETEMLSIIQYLPPMYQGVLLSATLDESLESLKKLYLKNPVSVKLEEDMDTIDSENQIQKISHYYLPFPTKESSNMKFLVLFVLLKLKLLQGRCLIFTSNSDTAYKLKIFLDIFYIKSVVINGELPLQSRIHMLEEANKGKYGCLIAADIEPNLLSAKQSCNLRKHDVDAEFGVSRGIDFKNIAIVINFDCPTSLNQYKHRIGRTGRGGLSGIALTFLENSELDFFSSTVISSYDQQASLDNTTFAPFTFDFNLVEGFRYRTLDALEGITKNVLLEARSIDLQKELAFNEKLAENSALLSESIGSSVGARQSSASRKVLNCVLHDKPLVRPSKRLAHMKNIPEYLFMVSRSKDEKPRISVPTVGQDFLSCQKSLKEPLRRQQSRRRAQKSIADPVRDLAI